MTRPATAAAPEALARGRMPGCPATAAVVHLVLSRSSSVNAAAWTAIGAGIPDWRAALSRPIELAALSQAALVFADPLLRAVLADGGQRGR